MLIGQMTAIVNVTPAATRHQLTRLVIDQTMAPRLVDRRSTDDWFLVVARTPIQLGRERRLHPPGWAICWQPGQDHRYGDDRGPWRHSCCHLTGSGMAASLRRVPIDRPFALADPILLHRCLQTLYQAVAGPQADAMLIDLLLQGLARCCRPLDDDLVIDPGLTAAKQHCDSHFDQAIDLDGLAAMAHMSRSSFTAGFRAAFGQSAIDYLRERRLDHARYLLHERNLGISQIAQACGFNDFSYFSRAFRQRFGTSARELRRQLIDPATS